MLAQILLCHFVSELYGKNNLEATQIDQIFDTVLDAFGAKLGIVFSGKDEEKKVRLSSELVKQSAQKRHRGLT